MLHQEFGQPPAPPVKPTSCLHCRLAHIGCDKNRPCSRCIRLGKECMDSDKSLIQRRTSMPKPVQDFVIPTKLLSFDEHVPYATAFCAPVSLHQLYQQQQQPQQASQQHHQGQSNFFGEPQLAATPCATCRNVHSSCDRKRPCGRCVRLGIADNCVDPVSKRPVRNNQDQASQQQQQKYNMHSLIPPPIIHQTNPSGESPAPNIESFKQPPLPQIPVNNQVPIGWYEAQAPAVDPRILYLVGPTGWNSRNDDFMFDAQEDLDFPYFEFQREDKKSLAAVNNPNVYPTPSGSPPPLNEMQKLTCDISTQTEPFVPSRIMMNATFLP